MKRWILILITVVTTGAAFAEDWELFRGPSPVYNVAGEYRYDLHESEINDILRQNGLTLRDADSAKKLNIAGYRRYEKKAYAEAADLFRLAVRADASYYFPHWNLACVLSLLWRQGKSVDAQEIVSHIQYALLLDPATARKKLAADTDLDPVRSTDWFRELVGLADHGVLQGDEEDVSLNGIRIAGLAVEEVGPVISGPVYRPSPDNTMAVFIARWNDQPHVFLLTDWGLLVRVTEGMTVSMMTTAGGNIAWQPRGQGFVFAGPSSKSPGAAILYYEISSLSVREVFTAVEHQTEGIHEMNALRFTSADTVDFMGGGSLEYSFAGREYEVKLSSRGFRVVPGGRVQEGEDLRGGD